MSVIVPTYMGRNRLPAVVAPLLSDRALHELIIVVDGSTDGSFELLQDLARSDQRLRPFFVENSGDNAARQFGLECATGDVVLFMDDDVIAAPGLIEGHARHHAREERLVVIGYMPVRQVEPSKDNYPVRLYSRWYEMQCQDYERRPHRILENMWAGNTSLRRRDCLAAGIVQPAYDTRYGPDRELGLRYSRSGLRGRFDRALLASHLYSRSAEAFFSDVRSAGEGMWICHRLYGDLLGPLRLADFDAGLSRKTRWLVVLARRPRATRVAQAALSLGTRLTGSIRRFQAQENLAGLRAKVLQQESALNRSRRPVETPS